MILLHKQLMVNYNLEQMANLMQKFIKEKVLLKKDLVLDWMVVVNAEEEEEELANVSTNVSVKRNVVRNAHTVVVLAVNAEKEERKNNVVAVNVLKNAAHVAVVNVNISDAHHEDNVLILKF